MAPPEPEPPPPEAVQALLAQIDACATFRGSRRHRELLRHLVERAAAGDTASLKESVIAVEVFGLPAAAADRRDDSIVRVEARRLRERLARYFAGEGRDTAWRIELPVGSYVPQLRARAAAAWDPAGSRRARDLVERGEYFLRQPQSQQTLEQALDRFDAALRESPDLAAALVGAGRAWLNLALAWYRPPLAASEHAAEALRQALEREPAHAVAHTLLGVIQHSFRRDWPAARRHFRLAITHGPDNAFVHGVFGLHRVYRGELDAAEAHLLQARRLDPHYLNARQHMINLRIGQGRLDDAAAEIESLRDIAPGSMAVEGLAGLVALARGDAAAAVEHYRRACELAPGHPNAVASLAAALGAAGQVAEADALMADLARAGQAGPLSPYVRAVVHARCGRADPAFEALDEALALADPSAVVAPTDPSFAALRDDPRWPPRVAEIRRPRRD